MELKKINPQLRESLISLGLSEPTEMQSECFTLLKSGADCLIASPEGTGKTTLLAMSIIQQLASPGEESPRALVFVRDREAVLTFIEDFEKINTRNGLRIFGTHEKTNLDEDKNLISLGIDVLVGTPVKLGELFGTAGFNINRLRIFAVDDAQLLMADRREPHIMRISQSIARVQRVIFTSVLTEKVEFFADKLLDQDAPLIDFTQDEDIV